ncbi:MAG: ribbon-helix-helix domain-containing protein [Bellilinea sp.]
MSGKTESVTIRLTPEAKLVLDELSRETGRPVSELIRQLIRHRYRSVENIEVISGPELGEKGGNQ